jgi:hypothetical protein
MHIALGMLLCAIAASPAPPLEACRLDALAREVLAADYRGDRAELARLDVELARIPDGGLAEYRDYWRGFARWRRAINGFNETPAPGDLSADVEGAIASFRAALARRPDWIEARLALMGCWGNQIFLAGNDAARRQAILDEARTTYEWIKGYDGDNPRALWIRGGYELYAASAPASRGGGGSYEKAAATLRRGVDGAWREALGKPDAPGWEPRWGGPENLMNLAYLYSHAPEPDARAALAYAQGALTAVPTWHYVRDVLLPQIERLETPRAR